MKKPLLIIGNKNYSSWSLRAWLLLKSFDVDFDEQSIELFEPSAMPTLKKNSPTGKVPVLVYGEIGLTALIAKVLLLRCTQD